MRGCIGIEKKRYEGRSQLAMNTWVGRSAFKKRKKQQQIGNSIAKKQTKPGTDWQGKGKLDFHPYKASVCVDRRTEDHWWADFVVAFLCFPISTHLVHKWSASRTSNANGLSQQGGGWFLLANLFLLLKQTFMPEVQLSSTGIHQLGNEFKATAI